MSPDEPTPDPIDLSALTPMLDAARLDALVAATLERSASELERRRARPTLALVVVRWRRPVLTFAGLAAAAAVALFVMPQRRAARVAMTVASSAPATAALSDSASVAEWLGVPASYARLVEGASPSAARTTP